MLGMAPTTNTISDTAFQGQRPTSRGLCHHFCLVFMVLCICMGLIATIGWILGTYEAVPPVISALSLLLSGVVALGWLLFALLMIWSRTSFAQWLGVFLLTLLILVGLFLVWGCFAWKAIESYHLTVSMVGTYCILFTVAAGLGWLYMIWIATHGQMSATICVAMLLGTATCCGGTLGAWYAFVWEPIAIYRDSDRWGSLSAEEACFMSHRTLVCCPGPHDDFVYLYYCGDESSVPFLVWSLRWMPSDEEPRICTWGHALDALSMITNHSAGPNKEDWYQWYDANKNKSQREWWISGFVVEGYSEIAAGGNRSIRGLFSVMGRVPWGHPDKKHWLVCNAKRLLALMDEKEIKCAVTEVMQNGSIEEQCGVARYVEQQDRAYAEPILRKLAQSDERPTRLWASGILCRLLMKWRENPAGFIEKRLAPHSLSDDDFFSPSDANVVLSKVGIYVHAYPPYTEPRQSIIRVISTVGKASPQGPMSKIRIDWPPKELEYTEKGVATIAIEGLSPVTGKAVYSQKLIVTDSHNVSELRWLYDSKDDSVYISLPRYTCKVNRMSGKVIWEIGFGVGNCDNIAILEDWLILQIDTKFVFCDPSTGEILAKYFPSICRLFDDRITLVNGKLRAKDFDGAFYILAPPKLADR